MLSVKISQRSVAGEENSSACWRREERSVKTVYLSGVPREACGDKSDNAEDEGVQKSEEKTRRGMQSRKEDIGGKKGKILEFLIVTCSFFADTD